MRANNNKDNEDKIQINMKRGNILVNNDMIKPRVKVPKGSDILRMSSEIETAKVIKLHDGEEHIEKNSEFFSYAQKVRCIKDVEKGYTKMRIKFADATHISCGYRFSDPNGPFEQGFEDDGENGQGRNILNALKERQVKEVCVYVVDFTVENILETEDSKLAKI